MSWSKCYPNVALRMLASFSQLEGRADVFSFQKCYPNVALRRLASFSRLGGRADVFSFQKAIPVNMSLYQRWFFLKWRSITLTSSQSNRDSGKGNGSNSSKGSGNGSGNGSKGSNNIVEKILKYIRDNRVMVGIWSVIVTVIGLIPGYDYIYQRYERYYSWVFGRRLDHSSIQFKPPEFFIERPDLSKLIRRPIGKTLNETIIVNGNRGVGKSTAVEAAYCGEENVLLPASGKRNAEGVARSVINQMLGSKWDPKCDPIAKLEVLLTNIQSKNKKMPTIIVEVDNRWESADVEYLLLVAKRLGADRNLAHFVIIVSASLGSFDIKITYKALRCRFVTVDEATEKEAKEFFTKAFSSLQLPQEETDVLVKMAVAAGFQNFSEMSSVYETVKAGSSAEERIKKLEVVSEDHLSDCITASTRLLQKLGISRKGSKGFIALKSITAEGRKFKDFELVKLTGINYDELLKHLYEIKPHPLIIQLPSHQLTPSTKVMCKALDIALEMMQ